MRSPSWPNVILAVAGVVLGEPERSDDPQPHAAVVGPRSVRVRPPRGVAGTRSTCVVLKTPLSPTGSRCVMRLAVGFNGRKRHFSFPTPVQSRPPIRESRVIRPCGQPRHPFLLCCEVLPLHCFSLRLCGYKARPWAAQPVRRFHTLSANNQRSHRLVFRRLLHMINDEHFNRPFGRF